MELTLQARLHLWRQRNFPNATADEQREGIVEEVGELHKAHLKQKQGIRDYEGPHGDVAAEDAVGDILIFLAGYCSYRGWDMEKIYEETAKDVMRRDWIAYPVSGFPPGDHPDDVELSMGEYDSTQTQ